MHRLLIKRNHTNMPRRKQYGRVGMEDSGRYSPVDVRTAHIQVCVRVRPLLPSEQHGEAVVSCYPKDKTVALSNSPNEFQFDSILEEHCDQATLFDDLNIRKRVIAALEGYACTIFAYGQTGSGKTYTITGPDEALPPEHAPSISDPRAGIVPRAVYALYNELKMRASTHPDWEYHIRAGHYEIYNETVIDLLNPTAATKKGLPVRHHEGKGFYVEGQLIVDCESASDLLCVLNEGVRNRKVAGHALNADSSRSHAVFTVFVQASHKSGTVPPVYGKVHFVDLAGSERLKASKSSGETAKETMHINKSLMTLGKVIMALSAGDSFIPYRDSMLTKLLSDSLGGESMTLMVACITPCVLWKDETLSTLHYASRARRIRTVPRRQFASEKDRIIAELQEEIARLREQVGAGTGAGGSAAPCPYGDPGFPTVDKAPIGSGPSAFRLSNPLHPRSGVGSMRQSDPDSSGLLKKKSIELLETENRELSEALARMDSENVELAHALHSMRKQQALGQPASGKESKRDDEKNVAKELRCDDIVGAVEELEERCGASMGAIAGSERPIWSAASVRNENAESSDTGGEFDSSSRAETAPTGTTRDPQAVGDLVSTRVRRALRLLIEENVFLRRHIAKSSRSTQGPPSPSPLKHVASDAVVL